MWVLLEPTASSQWGAVPGACLSSRVSEGCPCGLKFTSADLNIVITISKHLPLLDTSIAECEWAGATNKIKSIIHMYRYL